MSETRKPRESRSRKESPGSRPQATPRRRRGLGGDEGGRLSRPLMIAILVIIAGGAYLFWPRGGGEPVGIGEQRSVLTAEGVIGEQPRSGAVDIDGEMIPLVPEQPAGATGEAADPSGAATGPTDAGDVARENDRAASASPTGNETRTETRTEAAPPPPSSERNAGSASGRPTAEPEAPVKPRATGPWAVQVGAFQSEANADGLVTQLADKGVDAQVRAAGTSSGDLVYRVWVGWFPSRSEAAAFARQERARIGEAYPVHR
jgi:cell division septation protein DedD